MKKRDFRVKKIVKFFIVSENTHAEKMQKNVKVLLNTRLQGKQLCNNPICDRKLSGPRIPCCVLT